MTRRERAVWLPRIEVRTVDALDFFGGALSQRSAHTVTNEVRLSIDHITSGFSVL